MIYWMQLLLRKYFWCFEMNTQFEKKVQTSIHIDLWLS